MPRVGGGESGVGRGGVVSCRRVGCMLRHVRTCSLSLAVEAFTSNTRAVAFFLPPNVSWRELRRVLDVLVPLVVASKELRLLSTLSLTVLRSRSLEILGILSLEGLDEGVSVAVSL